MSEYVKDPSHPNGWKVISYSKGKKSGMKDDGAPMTAEAMDEGADGGSEGEEVPDDGWMDTR